MKKYYYEYKSAEDCHDNRAKTNKLVCLASANESISRKQNKNRDSNLI